MASARIKVRLQPRADRAAIVGMRDDVLVVRVNAPPVDGRANLALRRLLASRAKVAATSVRIVRGEAARDKLVEVDGLAEAELLRRLLR